MRDGAAAPQTALADRWSRRSVISGLTALGMAHASSRSRAAEVGAERFCKVVMDTGLGPIGILLELGRAPLSAGDFLKYVDGGLYVGGAFYRTVRPDDDTNPVKIDVVQGGLTEDGKYLDPIAHEPTSLTGLRHRDGTISIARDAVGTGTAGAFFVCIGDQPQLDFGGRRNPDGQGFAAFGQVTNGMKLIRDIGSSKTQGPPGSAEGELLAAPVRIVGAHRLGRGSTGGGR